MPEDRLCRCNIPCTPLDISWAKLKDGVWVHSTCDQPLRAETLDLLMRTPGYKSRYGKKKGGYQPAVHFEYEPGDICCVTVPYATSFGAGIKVTTTDPSKVTCRLCLRHPRRERAIIEQASMSNLEVIPIHNLQRVVGSLIADARELGRTKPDFSMIELLSIAEALKDAARWRWYREHVYNNLTPEAFDKWVDEQMSKSNPVPAGQPTAS